MNENNRTWSLLAILIVTSLTFAAATGRLTPHHVDDTPSYLEYPFDSLSSALSSVRTPGYPAILQVLQRTIGLSVVPAFQWIVACVAAWWFAVELGQWKASRIAMWVSAFAIVFGCTSLDHQSTLATDALAASVGVVTVAMTLRWIRRDRRHIDAAMVILAAMLAILLRPAYLPIIIWIGCLGIVLLPPTGDVFPSLKSRVLSSLRVTGFCVVLIFSWMTMRWAVVDDFGLLPFGHQNLAGLTLQMVSDDELKDIASEDPNPMTMQLVNEAIKQRDSALVKFQRGPGLPTMTMESQWNDVIYQAVVPASFELHPSDPVARHRIIGDLNRLVIQKYPGRYVRWLVLALRRAVWGTAANILMNPLFLFFWVIAGCYWLARIMIRQPWRSDNQDNPHRQVAERAVGHSPAVTLIAVVALSYAVVMVSFVVLTSPPIGRFADASSILIPCWLMTWASESLMIQSEKVA
ncbi:hypothetical protein [Rubripirellula obstinata]|uniref:hypothetical protein n=1 Tax=Rubripirellula obstinata TaxID=406547 RepID=UPI00122CAFF0|nr:hypothetical protein [Rubripirellula obstinata]